MKTLIIALVLTAFSSVPAFAAEKGGNLDGIVRRIEEFRIMRDCRPFYQYCESATDRLSYANDEQVRQFKDLISVEEGLSPLYRRELRQILNWCCN